MGINRYNILSPRPLPRKCRKKFRGKKRYYRNLNKRIDAWLDALKDADLQNSWHFHADFYGYGNLGGNHRISHLKVLCKIFRHVASMIKHRSDVFIWMHFDCNGDSGLDSFYFNMKDDNEATFYDPSSHGHDNLKNEYLFYFLTKELSPHAIKINFYDLGSCGRYYISL